MPSPVAVTIHPSQFPQALQKELLHSLRTRRVSHKFHYDSLKQTQKWLALHHAYSPSEKDTSSERAYAHAFAFATKAVRAKQVQVLGLCCGDGNKEKQLIRALKAEEKQVSYVPSDSSVVMALTAYDAALPFVPASRCHPLVCDLQAAADLPEVIKRFWVAAAQRRIVTLFGTIHNYPPPLIAGRLAGLIGKQDLLLVGANMAPAADYSRAVRRIAKQYDNELTHDWLNTFLFDLGITARDGAAETVVERCPFRSGLLRIAIYFRFARAGSVKVGEQIFRFRRGQRVRLFFSYRYTPELLAKLFHREKINVLKQWVSASGEEGVFLCKRGLR
ncbi:MAG TPA: L-histidine N(alpha)-methyltransferase [Verrucomicrobiae bacterium]|jgi:uncharacterized SAM-dependent methyltransferase|nr:L-histidine N(alpha)-methyltransferase [Verrucomicrobiae bacterium]